MVRQYRWMLPFFAVVLGALVVASAVQTDPRPALHGTGLVVLVALIGYLGALGWGIVFRTRLRDPPTSWRLLGLVGACALALAIAQPDGAGTLALYITLGVACSRLEPRRAIPGFTVGIVAATCLHKLLGPDDLTWGDLIIADASAVIFFYLGYIGRQFRLGQDRAERMVEELEAGREAQAAAIALRERGRTAREMHDVLAHSLSALAVQLEGTRLLARSTGADPAVVEAVERSHRLAKDGLEEARRAIDALRGGDMPGPDRLPALADAVRGADRRADPALDRRRPARAAAGRPARDLPHGAGGAHQRPPPRGRRARRAAAPLRRGRHVAHRRGPRAARGERLGRGRPRLRPHRDARARRAARRAARGGADRRRLPRRALPPAGPMSDAPIRVLLADDQRVVREGLSMLVGLLPGIEVVGTAADGEEAVRLAVARAPDVVLMDLRMPRVDGVEATRRLATERPAARVIALTTFADEPTVLAALRAGARGYLTKDAGAEEIHRAILAVARGEAALDAAIQHHVLAAAVEGGGADELPDGLTPREAEVLALIADGLTNAEIAERLVVSPATVKSHVNHLFAKADLRDRAQAVAYAYRTGIAAP